MSDTNRRIDNGKFILNKSMGTLVTRNATIGNLTVTGTTTTTGNSAVQFSNMTVTGTLGAGTVNATTSSIGNLTVTGTLVNNATTQFAAVSVTGNASVGGNVVVGGDGIFTGNVRFGNSGTYGLWSNGTIVASGVTVAQGGNTATLGGTGITTSGLLAVGTMTVSGNASVSGNVSVKDINATGNVAVAQNAFVTGNLTVTGTFVNNATTQFAGMTVTGNAIVGGNVVVGGDGIFCGATSGVTTLATTQYTSNVGLLYTTGTGLNTPANIISTGIITLTNNTSNQFGFVDYTTPTMIPGTPFRIGFDYLYAGAADGFCAQLWFSNNAPTTVIGSNADRSVTNAAIGYRFGYDIFSNQNAGFYQNANVSSGASVSLAKSASALPGNSWCTYTWTFDGASVWTTQVSNAANTAQMYMANVVVDSSALGIWTAATYPNTLRMYGASGGSAALQQIRNVTVSTTTLGNVLTGFMPTLTTTQYTSNVGLLYTTGTGLNTPANIISTGIITLSNNTSNQFGFVDYTIPKFVPGTPFGIAFDYLYTGAADGFCAQLWFSDNAPVTTINSSADRSVTNAAIGYRFGYDIFSNKTAGFYRNANVSSGASVSLATSASALPGSSWCTYTWTFDGASVWTTQVSNAANTAQMYMANVVVDSSALGIWTAATYPNTLRMYGASGGQTALQQIRNLTFAIGKTFGKIGASFVGAANVSTGAYVASSTGTGSAPIVGNTYVSFVGNGTANGGYLDAGPQTFTRFSTGATAMAYVAFTAPNVTTQSYEAICSFGNGTNTFRLNRNGNTSTTIMFVSDSVGNTCVAGNAGNIVPYVPSVWTGVFTPPTTCTMYQNATLVNTNTNPGKIMSLAPSTVMPHTYIGKSQFGDPYASMNLYGFVYWNASLTPAQITQAYTYLTAGTGSLPRPEAISAPLTILPTAPNALVGNSAYVPNVTAQNGNVTATNANASSVGVTNSVTIAGNLSVVTDVNARGDVAVSKNVVVTGNVSATDVNATGNLAVTKFATVTGGINLPGNAAAAFGTPGNAAVVLTTASFANVLSYANTSDTLANIAATGNLILTNNTANQVQSVTYVVPGLAPGVAFSANVGFTFGTSGQAAGNAGGDAYAIQFFPTENGTYPLTTNSINLGVVGIADTRYGYLFAYLFGNNTGGQSKIGIYSFSPSSGSRSALTEYYNPNLQANVAYNFFVGFDGVSVWTYKVSNSTTVIASGTATDPAALYNMSMALYPTTVRIRANSNAGISLITANAVSIVANVGVGYASATANASGFIVTNSNNATMMTVNASAPYTTTLGSVIANVAATVGPGSLNVFGPTYFGNSTTITGPTTVSGPSTFSGATTFNAPVTLNANIVPNATSGIVWNGGTPTTMIESYYGVGDRYGLGVAVGNAMRIYTSSTFGSASVALGKYSTVGGIQTTDWIYANAWPTYAGVNMTSNVSVASNVSSSTGNVILAAQTIRVTGGDLGNNSVLVLNASGGTQNNMINLWGANPSGTATNVWGFGLASGTLRYNAILTSHIHGFYSNTFTCATIWYSGTAIAGNANSEALTVTNSYGTGFTGNAVTLATTTAAGAGFNMLMATANGVKQFRVAGNGATYANGPYSSAGADYAEYFEWADGNPGAEDRRGLTVVLDGGDKIRIATISDASTDVIGVVSAVPTTIGDSAWSRWQGMYVTDAFGCPTTELNPAYDPDVEYVPRSERKEWAPIGLIGKLRVLTGRPVGSSWIRMKTDITPGVDLWLVRRPRL